MKNIKQSYLIAASAADVWRALTDPELIEQWSGADAEFEPEAGIEYSLWDGSIVGKVVEVVPGKKLVQTWKPDDWTIDNSVVTFTLTLANGKTRVDLLHENVEEFDFEGTTEGWDLYYLGAIKRMLDAQVQQPRSTKTTKTTKAAKKKVTKKTPTAKRASTAKKRVAGKKTTRKKK